jgi:catechol 2,3-dioxygenase-like lactoylglutathione lyase family enzyme
MEDFLILGVRHVGFVVKSMEVSQRFYEELGFEPENTAIEEFGPNISKLVGIKNVRIKTLKLRLKHSPDGIWREGGFRFELIEYLIPKSLSLVESNNNIVAKGHLCFTVKDIAVTAKKILELGGSLPFEFVLDTELKPIIAYVLDPDGIPIELNASR